jgi:sterol desaturase/sphingolipid hydroxylase (fatty acid hydroxylase superfamily)
VTPDFFTQYLNAVGGGIEDYLIACGLAYFFFHLLLKKRLARRKITQEPTGLKAPAQEIGRAIVSNILGKGPLVVSLAYLARAHVIPSKLIYNDISHRGWAYFALTVVFDFLVFDLWFYLSHRFILHSRIGYRFIHIVHHRSVDPTPFARNSVHPLEGIFNQIFHLLPIFILPHHPAAILVSTQLKGLVGILGHLGYETFWSGYTRHWFFRYFITPVHHHLHHAKSVRTNFSFFINYDLILGTLNPDYHEAFEATVNRQEGSPALVEPTGARDRAWAP